MKKTGLIIMLIISILLSGCNDADNWMDEDSGTCLEVSDVAFSLKSAGEVSKSYFNWGDKIGLNIYSPKGISYKKMTYLNPGWTLESPVLLSKQSTDIYATYPYVTDNTDPIHFVIEHVSQTDYLYSDLYSVNKDSPALSLTMKHALALIEFEFEYPPMEGGYIEHIAIEGPGLHSRAKMNLVTGNLEYMSGYNEPAILYGWQMHEPFIMPHTKISLMVVPVKDIRYNWDIAFSMYIGRSKYHCPVPAGTVWESGKRYSYTVRFNERILEIMRVQIHDWIDAGKENISLSY